MSPGEVKQLVQQIVNSANTAGAFVGIIDPALIPFIAIGQALDQSVPGLAKLVASWVEGNPPTDEEKAEMLKKLAVLGDPNNP